MSLSWRLPSRRIILLVEVGSTQASKCLSRSDSETRRRRQRPSFDGGTTGRSERAQLTCPSEQQGKVDFEGQCSSSRACRKMQGKAFRPQGRKLVRPYCLFFASRSILFSLGHVMVRRDLCLFGYRALVPRSAQFFEIEPMPQLRTLLLCSKRVAIASKLASTSYDSDVTTASYSFEYSLFAWPITLCFYFVCL